MSTFTAESSDGALYYVTTGGGSVQLTERVGFRNAFNPLFMSAVLDGMVVTPTPHSKRTTFPKLEEMWRATDATGMGHIYFLVILNGLVNSDSVLLKFKTTIAEVVYAWERWAAVHTTSAVIGDSLGVTGHYSIAFPKVLHDIFTATGHVSAALGLHIIEKLRGTDATKTAQHLHGLVVDHIHFGTALRLALPVLVADSIIQKETLHAFVCKLGVIAEEFKGIGAAHLRAMLAGALRDVFNTAASERSGISKAIAERLGVSPLLSVILKGHSHVADLVAYAAIPGFAVHIRLELHDSTTIIDPPSGQLFGGQVLLQALIEDHAEFKIGYNASNGLWDGYVVNTNTNAASQYQGWNFNSFTQFFGHYLGASSTEGLGRLGGAQDGANAIQATLQTAVTDFGSSHQKHVRSAYLGIAAEGTCYLQVLTDDNIQRVYQLVPNAPGIGTERVDLPRGLQSRYWSFSLQSTDGSAWRLDNLEVLPVVLSRRVR